VNLPSTHIPAWLGVRTRIPARAISDRGTLVPNNSRRGTTMRVRFEERLERQLAGGNPRNSPRASYTFPVRDTTKLRAGESDAGADALVPSISVLIKGHAPLENRTLPNRRSISLELTSLLVHIARWTSVISSPGYGRSASRSQASLPGTIHLVPSLSC
jgi:hypothetical protein